MSEIHSHHSHSDLPVVLSNALRSFSTLVSLLEDDLSVVANTYITHTAIACLYAVFELPIAAFKGDVCRVFARHG